MQYRPSAVPPLRFSAPPADFGQSFSGPSLGQSYSGPGPNLGQSYSAPGPNLGQSYSGPSFGQSYSGFPGNGPSLGQSYSGQGLGQSFPQASGFRSITPKPFEGNFMPAQHVPLSPRTTQFDSRSLEGYVPVLPGYKPMMQQQPPQVDSDVDPDMYPEQYKRMLDAPTGSWFKAPAMMMDQGRSEQVVSDVDVGPGYPSQRGPGYDMVRPKESARSFFPDYVPGGMSVDFLRAPLVPTLQTSVQDSRPIWGPIPASERAGRAPMDMMR